MTNKESGHIVWDSRNDKIISKELTSLEHSKLRIKKIERVRDRNLFLYENLGVSNRQAFDDFGYIAMSRAPNNTIKWHNTQELLSIIADALVNNLSIAKLSKKYNRSAKDLSNLIKLDTPRAKWAASVINQPLIYPVAYLDSMPGARKFPNGTIVYEDTTHITSLWQHAPIYQVPFPEYLAQYYQETIGYVPMVFIDAVTRRICTLELDTSFSKSWGEIDDTYNCIITGYDNDNYPIFNPRYRSNLPADKTKYVSIQHYPEINVNSKTDEPIEVTFYDICGVVISSNSIVNWTFRKQATVHSAMLYNIVVHNPFTDGKQRIQSIVPEELSSLLATDIQHRVLVDSLYGVSESHHIVECLSTTWGATKVVGESLVTDFVVPNKYKFHQVLDSSHQKLFLKFMVL